ncbi:organic hydroperoxide resistance protein [Alteromonas australica]|jgi:Ohr subfamily peroxiredoxin|uniref:Organic hydroperoxide resistance protein n=1 Tax=Alteromonas australica TaxID=589873 RepID=A0A075NWX5_9ALTE|nr:organic hydroperoxide resistance protein [Alteromonas australica]AIF97953.1 organic hydroperoxide resistance protein [Alteromonas australica]
MHKLQQVIYTGTATATGGREGTATSSDGNLSVTLSTPKALGGAGGEGTNPEQMFAAGYSACFIGALKHVAAADGVKLDNDIKVTGDVSIGPIEVGFAIAAKLSVDLGSMDKEQARSLVEKAHQVCPYSNATRGNIEVEISLV